MIPDPLRDPAGDILQDEVLRYLLGQEVERSLRYGEYFSLCVVGVTTPGPAALVPEVLRLVGRALAARLRRTDPIGRVPDAAFGVVLLYVTDQGATQVAERLHGHLRELAAPGAPLEGVEISVGVACFPRHGQSPEALLRHAAECLAVARQLGGNRVVSELPGP